MRGSKKIRNNAVLITAACGCVHNEPITCKLMLNQSHYVSMNYEMWDSLIPDMLWQQGKIVFGASFSPSKWLLTQVLAPSLQYGGCMPSTCLRASFQILRLPPTGSVKTKLSIGVNVGLNPCLSNVHYDWRATTPGSYLSSYHIYNNKAYKSVTRMVENTKQEN